jgi:hypothetical protein
LTWINRCKCSSSGRVRHRVRRNARQHPDPQRLALSRLRRPASGGERPSCIRCISSTMQAREGKIDETHVHSRAYLPQGYCEKLKAALERVLAERIYAEPASPTREPIFEYNGSRFESSDRGLARGAGLEVTCQDDGALRMSAPRKLPRRASAAVLWCQGRRCEASTRAPRRVMPAQAGIQ